MGAGERKLAVKRRRSGRPWWDVLGVMQSRPVRQSEGQVGVWVEGWKGVRRVVSRGGSAAPSGMGGCIKEFCGGRRRGTLVRDCRVTHRSCVSLWGSFQCDWLSVFEIGFNERWIALDSQCAWYHNRPGIAGFLIHMLMRVAFSFPSGGPLGRSKGAVIRYLFLPSTLIN